LTDFLDRREHGDDLATTHHAALAAAVRLGDAAGHAYAFAYRGLGAADTSGTGTARPTPTSSGRLSCSPRWETDRLG
jgi:hypothetical protein